MKIIRIILAAIVMFLCVIFFVSLVAAVLGAWTFNQSLSAAAIGVFAPIERVAGQTQQGLAELRQRVETGQGEITTLRAQMDELTAEIEQNRELRVSIATTLTTRLEPIVQVITQDLGQVREGLSVVNDALDALDSLPFVDLNLPRLERLQEIESNVSTLTTQLTRLRASGDRVGAAAQEVLPEVSQGLDTLNETADVIQGRLNEVDANIVQFTGRLESLKQGIDTGFTVVTWAEIFVLAWLAASQVSLFSHAYQWARKP